MIRTSELHFFKKMASEKFKLKDSSFICFTDIGRESGNIEDLDLFEIVAEMKISYTGTTPDSYRVLNSLVLDWVDSNEGDLKKSLNPSLKNFLILEYPEIDSSALDENFDDFIWEDQVDYHPEINEGEKAIYFTLDLVLSVEEEYKE